MKNGKRFIFWGTAFLLVFSVWTSLVISADVKPMGVNGTDLGLSTMNLWFFELTGANIKLYTITDWLGLVPVAVCLIFGVMGAVQLIKRRSIIRVDSDTLLVGVYYVLVITAYLLFEEIPINYRPILIDGFMESSYPSSTTLLVLGVMPTLMEQAHRRVKKPVLIRAISIFSVLFMVFMVLGRLLSGVHWLSDIVGSVLLSVGLFLIYKGAVDLISIKQK